VGGESNLPFVVCCFLSEHCADDLSSIDDYFNLVQRQGWQWKQSHVEFVA
jgi:hypothetical protein